MKELSPPKKPFSFIFWCTSWYRKWAIGAITAVFFAALMGRGQIFLVKVITDTAAQVLSQEATFKELWYWTIAFPLLYYANEWVWRCSGFCGMRWITGVVAVVYEKLFAYLSRHSAEYFSNRFAGALTNKISNASQGAEHLIMQSLWHFYPLGITIAADTFLSYQAHPYLALVLVTWITIFFAINLLLVRKLHSYSYRHAEIASNLKGKIVDSTSNIETVQQSGEVHYEQLYINKFIRDQRIAHYKKWFANEWVLVLDGTLLALFMGAMLLVSIWLMQDGIISVGSVVMIITIVIAIERHLFFIGHQLIEAMSNYGQLNEGLTELLKPHDVKSEKSAENLVVSSGSISLESVHFAYGKLQVFKDFNLDIPAGQKVGLVGPSGAGKSTLVNLLLRQYDLDKGIINIDEQDISKVDLDSLRKAIALVPQNISLFHRSILENIHYGRLDASEEEVLEAARLAQVDEFVSQLPNQYATYVGERGVKLSGGQRQRISIARAILKNTPILILDEATSSLDSESELAIQAALAKLMEGKTVIAVAHRLSTLRSMDRLVVLDKGDIVEEGEHARLLEDNKLYARLWHSQVGGFLQY